MCVIVYICWRNEPKISIVVLDKRWFVFIIGGFVMNSPVSYTHLDDDDDRTPYVHRKKIFAKDEGEYVDYEEVK